MKENNPKINTQLKQTTTLISTKYAKVELPIDVYQDIVQGKRFASWKDKFCYSLKKIWDNMVNASGILDPDMELTPDKLKEYKQVLGFQNSFKGMYAVRMNFWKMTNGKEKDNIIKKVLGSRK